MYAQNAFDLFLIKLLFDINILENTDILINLYKQHAL